MKNKKELEKFSLKDQLNSIQTDMFQLELIKMLNLINQSQSTNSKPKSAELKDFEIPLNSKQFITLIHSNIKYFKSFSFFILFLNHIQLFA